MIETARMILRAAREADLTDLHAIYGDARAMRYWSDPPHPDLATTRQMLERLIASSGNAPMYFVFEHDGRAIGTGGIHEGNEIGFILHPGFWRRGLAREAVSALITHYFSDLSLAEITADVDPRNAASMAFLTALGFRETGRVKNTFCIDGVWTDSVYFALSRTDWRPG